MRDLAWMALVVSLLIASAGARAETVPPFLEAETRLGKAYPQRAVAAGSTKPALSYAPKGAKVAEAGANDDLIVIEERGDDVRVAADGPIVRVAYWVAPAALAIVARKGAVVAATAAAATTKPSATSPGVRLRAGTALQVVEPARDGVTRVRLSGPTSPVIDGFLPSPSLGRGFVPEKPWKARRAQVELTTPVAVLDAPGGAPLASFTDDNGVEAIRLGQRKPGHVLVRIDLWDDVVVIGWVKADAVHPLPRGIRGLAHHGPGPVAKGPIGVIGPDHAPELARGEVLYDAPNGQPVAVVLQTATHTPTGSGPDGWTQYTLPGPWGPAVLYRRRLPDR